MSDYDQSRAGMCAAYGCPLAGSIGSDGKWYCFCHVNRPSSDNDRITRILCDEYDWLCQSTLDIRGARGTRDWPQIYRHIQQRIIRAERRDLLMCEKDESPNKPGYRNPILWLMRLERELIEATSAGPVKKIPNTVQTAPVAGPTHATEHYSADMSRLVEAVQ